MVISGTDLWDQKDNMIVVIRINDWVFKAVRGIPSLCGGTVTAAIVLMNVFLLESIT